MLFMPWKLNKSYCLIATVWYFRRSVRRSVGDGADERVCVSSLVPQIQKQVHLDIPSANSSSWVNITHLNRTNPYRLFIQTLAQHRHLHTPSVSTYINRSGEEQADCINTESMCLNVSVHIWILLQYHVFNLCISFTIDCTYG